MKFVAALASGLLMVGCVDDQGPRLSSVSPSVAGHGAQVVVSGSRLCGSPADCEHAVGEIFIGLDASMVKVSVLEFGDTSAMIRIPDIAPAGTTQLVATVNERSSNAIDFEVLP